MSTQSTVAPFKVFIHDGEIIAVIAPCRFEMAETHVDCFHCSTSGDAGAEYGATQIIKLTNEITLEEFERLNPRCAVEYFEHMGEDPRLRAPKQEASACNLSTIREQVGHINIDITPSQKEQLVNHCLGAVEVMSISSGGGFYHLIAREADGQIKAMHLFEDIIEMSYAKWDSIDAYYDACDGDEDGFGYEPTHPNYDARSSKLFESEGIAYNHSTIADRLLDDGDMGEFLRGELGAVACDDGDEAVKIIDEVISKLTAMRNHVAIREAAERIDAMNCTCAIDKDVETHSEAFRIIHGYQANWLENEAECDDVWLYPRHPVYAQLRNLIK